MNDWLVTLNDFSSAWADGMVRACWQGGVAILFVWGLCRLLTRMPPAAKCWLWRLAYLKLFVALVWAAPIALPLLPAHGPRPESSGNGGAIRAEASSSLLSEDARHDSKTASRQPVAAGLRAKSEHAPPTVASWLLAAWLLAAGWNGIRVMRSWHGVRRLLASSRPARDRQLVAKLAQLSRELGPRRAPSLRTSDAVGSPSLLGVVRPAIVLPTSLLHVCGPAELRLALAHELAHLRRRDLLWNWLPTLAEVLFFFHPAVWLARRQWLFAQELACDEMAARVSRSTAVEMGRLLLQIASYGRCGRSTSLLTAEVSTSFSQIRRRLIAMRSPDSLHGRRKLLVAALVCLLAGAGGLVPWRVTARESGGAEASSPADAAQDNTSSGSAAHLADRPQLSLERYQRVAVIDMQYLFQHDKAFAESLAEVKRQQRAAEAELRKKSAETRRLSGGLARLRPGTPDHGKLEEEIA
ncbi:MAG: M48 family metalloprotease, partial [Planctomycetes bacterium]|nr:M48 family metalloprotease [Planctomycetota bacterium]